MRRHPVNHTQKVRRALRGLRNVLRLTFSFVLAVVTLLSFPGLAHAERWGSATYSSNTYTQTITQTNAASVIATYAPSGQTWTSDATAGSPPPNNNGIATFPQKNATAAMFSPNIPTGTTVMGFVTSANGCAGSASSSTRTTCSGKGTITITFSRPVTDPRLHIMGIGGSSGTTALGVAGTLTSSPGGATMSVASGAANLSVSGGTTFQTTSTQPNSTCDSSGSWNGTAGCGTLQISGTAITSLTLTLSILTSGGGTTTTLANSAGDHYALAISLPDQPMPTANPDTASVIRSETVSVNPLANDTPASGIPLVPSATVFTATSGWTLSGDGKTLSSATYGVFTLASDGTATFDPVDTYVGAVPAVNYRITDEAGSTASSTITITVLDRPKIVLRKTTIGAPAGPFAFTLTNTTQSSGTVTTTAADSATQVDGDTATAGTQAFTASTGNTPVTITETAGAIPSGWALAGATCTNASNAVVGTLSGTTYTLPASQIVGNAVITCTFSNGRPGISLTKTAGTATGSTAGSTIPYTFTVTNTGQTPLSSIVIADTKLSSVSCAATSLAVGASTTCTGNYPLTQADVDAGQVVNNASVSGTTPSASTVAASATATKSIPQAPAITLTKSAGSIVDNDANGHDVGDTIPYSFVVKNTGNVTLSSIAVNDPKVGTLTCPTTTLAPNASTTCTATYTLLQTDVNAGRVDNSASVSGTPPIGAAVTASSSASVTITRSAKLTLVKTAGTPSGNTVGSTILYSFLVTNTGNVTLTGVNVTDAKVGPVNCPTTTLLPGASTTCTATYPLKQSDVDAGKVDNTASVTATPPTGMTAPTATSSTSTMLTRTPALTLDKQSSGVTDLDGNGPDAGDSLGHTFLITNTGNVTLNPVSVADSKVASVSCPVTTLAPNASTTCTGSYTLSQGDFDAGHVYNTATASGVGPSGTWTATATDNVDTTLAGGPAITLHKTAGTPSGSTVGSTIAYTFVVANSGNVTLNGIWLQDNKVFSVSCPQSTLAPQGTMTCSAIYTLTQADLDAGSVVNSATVTGYSAGTGTPAQATDGTTTTIARTATIAVDKQAGTPTGNTAGSTIAYTFIVVNTGNVTLTSVGVTDPRIVGGVSCPQTMLEPGGSTTCSATYTLTQADIDAGHVANTATATGMSPTGAQPTASDSTDTTISRTTSISLDKQAGTPSGNTAGSTIAYTFIVVNTGNVTLTSVTVTDTKVGAVTCPSTTLAPGASVTCVATYPISLADLNAGVVNNTASVTGTPPSGMVAPTATDSTTTALTRTPAISLDKSAGSPSGNTAGSTIAYSFLVTNTGNVTLTSVTVSDAKVGTVSCPATTLVPGASTTCTATYSLTQADVDAGTVDNTASVTGTPPTGLAKPTATDSTSTTISAAPRITLVKTAGAPSGTTAGSTITYSFVVTNTGNVTVHSVAVSDALVPSVSCPATTLAPAASTTCTGMHSLTQAEIDAGTLTNHATASGTPPTGPAVTATGTTTSALTRTAGIALDKQAGVPTGNTVGSTIAYTFLVTNTGNVTLTSVHVNDATVGTVTCPATTLAPGASTTCTGLFELDQATIDAGHVANNATVTGTPPDSVTPPSASDSTDVSVAQNAALTLDKQAGTPSGTTAGSTILYTFVVANAGNVTLSSVGLTDTKVGAVTCPVASLTPGASTTCTKSYTLTQADVDAGHVANTATATGTPPSGIALTASDSTDTTITSGPAITLDKTAGAPSGNTAGSTIAYSFLVTNTGNVTLTSVKVTDAKVGTVTCPTTTLAPGASTMCAATYTLTQADVDSGQVINTATASGTPPTGSAVTATDSVTAPITATPLITLDKQAGMPSGNTAGSSIAYTFIVQNTGNVTLHAVGVTDPVVGAVTCPATTLAPGASTTCTKSYTLTQADVDAGHVANTATASGTPPTGSPVEATDNTDTPITPGPAISLHKTAGMPSGNTAGSTIAYTFLVTNTGNVTLTDVGVSDPTVGTVSCPVTTLAPGASTTCTKSYTLTQADVDAGHVDNTATASGTPPTGAAVTGTDSVTSPISAAPSIAVDKQAGAPSGNTAGSTIAYTFVVQNTGNVTLHAVGVSDPKVGTVTCPVTTLVPGASTTCHSTYWLTQADLDAGSVNNTATATGAPPTGSAVTATDSTMTTITAAPALTLDKQASAPTGHTAGSTIAYSFVLRNTGNVTLTAVGVSDPKAGTVTCPVTSLAPGETTTCQATYTLLQADVDAGHVANTATASGTSPTGGVATATDSTDTTLPRTPMLTLDKQAGTPTGNTAGSTITYTFVVTNAGNVTLSSVDITDLKVSTVSCPAGSLAPGASLSCTATYVLTQEDVDAGHVANSATASATPPSGVTPPSANDTTDTPIAAAPALTLDKQAGTPSGFRAGATIDYTFLVTNTGNVSLTTVGVSDPKVGTVACPDTTLAPSASTTCTATYALTQADVDAGHVDNTATASGTPPAGAAVTVTDSVTTPITASPAITIDKEAGTPSGTTLGSTIAYTFLVQNSGNVTLHGMKVTDPKVGTVSCPVTELAPGATTACHAVYVLTQNDVDAGHVANTATASGISPAGATVTGTDGTDTSVPSAPGLTLAKQAGTPSGAAAGSTIAYTFVVQNAGNVTLTSVGVTDPMVGAVTCPVPTLSPGASMTCHATYTLTQADVDAGQVANTASASGTPPTGASLTSTASVTTPLSRTPGISLDKQAGTPSGTGAGSTIDYTFVVQNTGNVTLATVGVDDSKVGALTCPTDPLAPGASLTCTATYTLTQADVDAGHVANSATATGTPPDFLTPPTAADQTDTPIAAGPSISVDKQAGTPSDNTAGSTIDYTFVVTNTGNVTLTTLAVSDPLVGTVSCPTATLAPSASTTCTATYVLTQEDVDAGHVANTATVSGISPAGAAVESTDSTDTPISSDPGLTLDKRAGTPSGNTAGSTIGYSFVLVNTGNVTLTSVSVTDPKVGAVTCPVTTLAPGASTTCTATYPLTQADVDAGVVDNTATAAGTPPTGAAEVATDSTSTPITAVPGLTLDKRAGTPSGITAGSTIDYTFVMQNTGNVTLSGVSVNDPKTGTVSCPAGPLAPGASATCTATYTLLQSDVDAGHVANMATASATPPTGAALTGTDSTDTPITSAPVLTLDKQAGTPSGVTVGSTMVYQFAITNSGNVTLTSVSVADSRVGTVSCPDTTVDPGDTLFCSATYTLTQADVDSGQVVNIATASATPPTGAVLTATDSTTTPIVPAPAITLDKRAGTPSSDTAGSTIDYTFVVANTGNVTLTTVAVNDPTAGPVTCPVTNLLPGATATCTATYTLTQADVDAGHVANTATVSGTPPAGDPVTATDSTDTSIVPAPSLSLDKHAGTPSGSTAGSTIDYTFTVQNTGNVTLSAISLDDPLVGPVTCPAGPLAPGASVTCSATYPLTQADVDAGHVANTATASATPPTGPAVTGTDSTDSPISAGPALTLVKQAGTPSGNTAGSTIAYNFVVTNTGNVTLTAVGVTDPQVGAVSCPATTLGPNASTTCTATYVLTQADVDAGEVVNTATASGTPPVGAAVSGVDTVTTTIDPAPAVSLLKQAGAPSGNTAGSTIGYSFVVTNTGNVTLDPISVDDPLAGPVTCPVTTLAPNASTTCTATYTLTQADVDAGRVDNMATTTGTPPAGPDVTSASSTSTAITATPGLALVKSGTARGDRAGDEVDYSFVVANTGNVTLDPVSVDDPLVGAVTCPAGPLVPNASTTCTGVYTLTQADVDAGHVPNTATASGTPPAGAAVTAEGSHDLPIAPGPYLSLVKQATPPATVAVGSIVGYTFTVTNTGNVTLDPIAVDDPLVGLVDCPVSSLAGGASTTCTATYALTQADIDAGGITNSATASGTPPTGAAVTGTDTVTTPLAQVPAIGLAKTPSATSGLMVGDTVDYTFVVTNTGNVTLAGVSVSDPMLGAVTCPLTTLAPGESTTCTAPAYMVTTADSRRGRITNTATAAASFCGTGDCVVVDSIATAVAATRPSAIDDASDGDNSGSGGNGSLAYTGFGGTTAALFGAGILATGVLLLVVGRRRRQKD